MQWRKHVVRIGVGEVDHPCFFDQMACLGQHLKDSLDDFVEQGLQLRSGGRRCFVEHRFAFARLTSRALVNPIESQAMQVNVQIRRRAKTLNKRYRAGTRFVAWQFGLTNEVGGDDALYHRQRFINNSNFHCGIV